jgi:molecular chaperone Hsp33
MNHVQHFLFDQLDVRGRFIRLESEWQTWQKDRHYTETATHLLGQCAAFIALTASDIKHLGRLTLQLTSNGVIKTLVVQCGIEQERLTLRGMIDAPELTAESQLVPALQASDLAMTLYSAPSNHEYQSFVPIEGESLADILAHYLTQSVQQPTMLWLSATTESISGLILEKMPDTDHKDPDGWNRLIHLTQSLTTEELNLWSLEDMLQRLYHQETLIIYEPISVLYHCPKDLARIDKLLLSLGEAECRDILSQEGRIIISNAICNHDYVYDQAAIDRVFKEDNKDTTQ